MVLTPILYSPRWASSGASGSLSPLINSVSETCATDLRGVAMINKTNPKKSNSIFIEGFFMTSKNYGIRFNNVVKAVIIL